MVLMVMPSCGVDHQRTPLLSATKKACATRAFFVDALGGGSGLPPTSLCENVDGEGLERLRPTPAVVELEQIDEEGREEALPAADVLSGLRPIYL